MDRFLLYNQTLRLLPQKCIFWEEESALIMSDLHLGKVTHFRKAGIQAPVALIKNDIEKLELLLHAFKPKKWIIVGDLFHSTLNAEWELFSNLVDLFTATETILVRGNHDSMPAYVLKNAKVKSVSTLFLDPFAFAHHPILHSVHYVISGHVHPAIMMQGKAKQSLKLSCFYFGASFALLPAFGNFTGHQIVKPRVGDTVFAIAGQSIIKI